MDPNLLLRFLQIAESRSLRASAERLGVSQPAMTKSLRKLETEVGSPLFERHSKGMTLTLFGQKLLVYAKAIRQELEFAQVELSTQHFGELGRLRIAAGFVWVDILMPEILRRFHRRYPKVRIELDMGVNANLVPRLAAGDLDLICGVPSKQVPLPDVIIEPAFEVVHHVVCSKAHPILKSQSTLNMSQICEYPFVIYEFDTELIRNIFSVTDSVEKPTVIIWSESIFAAMRLIESGAFISCLPHAVGMRHPYDDSLVVPISLPTSKQMSSLMFKRAHQDVAHLAYFRKLVHAVVAEIKAKQSGTDA
jgi:DNA-binding transcriptional LysR family regulator